MSTPLVSVIIPVYNAEAFIEDALNSALKQTHPNFELICIDDGSTDSSLDILKSYAAEHTNIRVFEKPNEGLPAKARNYGIKHCKGEYIAFLDADDVWHPEKLAVQMNLMREKNIQWSCSSVKGFTDLDREQFTTLTNSVHFKILNCKSIVDSLSHYNFISLSSVILNSSLLPNERLFDTSEDLKVAEDYWLWSQLAQTETLLQIEESLVLYRFHDQNVSGDKTRLANGLFALAKKAKNKNFPMRFLYGILFQASKTAAKSEFKRKQYIKSGIHTLKGLYYKLRFVSS